VIRKCVSILTLVAMLSLLYYSCEQGGVTEITEPKDDGSLKEFLERAGRIEVDEPGEIHNEVLTLYCEKHRPLSGGRLGREEFTSHLSGCINRVFELRGIDVCVTPEHISGILGEFERLKRAGIIDVTHPTREDLLDYLDHLVDQDLIEPHAADEYGRALTLCGEYDSKGGSRRRLAEELSAIDTGDAERDRMFTDILIHSRDFWTGLEKEEIMVTLLGDTLDSTALSPDESAFWEKIASYGTDALLGIACILVVPITLGISIAGLIASLTASILVDCTWADAWGDDYAG
jgi:hypothetical protein